MGRISGLPDELLVKILSYLPTKDAVSTSLLSKQWEFLWMWLPKLDYDFSNRESKLELGEFIKKNMPLHKAPVIESLHLNLWASIEPVDVKLWVEIAVSRCLRELTIKGSYYGDAISLPSSLYACKSLMSLTLDGDDILVDVPRTVSLPSLKTLQLRNVIYFDEDSLRLLLSYCPVLEDLFIERGEKVDNVKAVVVIVPSLQRLTLYTDPECPYDDEEYVIVTPSLKYFKVHDFREDFSYLVEQMPMLEEADLFVEAYIARLLESVTFAKQISLRSFFYSESESLYRSGTVFNQLEHLKIYLDDDYWSMLLVQLLRDSPKLRDLHLSRSLCFLVGYFYSPTASFGIILTLSFFQSQYVRRHREYNRIRWEKKLMSVPKCLKTSLETFKFTGYIAGPEERDFLSYFIKKARCLKSSSISPSPC